MHFVTSDIPYSLKPEVCRPEQRLYCTGSCFVHELPEESAAGLRLLVQRFREMPDADDRHRPLLLYMDTWLSSETNASAKYPESRIMTKDGKQLTYGHCAAGTDYPLFFGTAENAYGKQLDGYVDKALGMGYTGICKTVLRLKFALRACRPANRKAVATQTTMISC